MSYVVRIWCSVCTGVDFKGCNQGKAGYVRRIDLPEYSVLIDDAFEADTVGCDAIDPSGDRWDFEVEEWSKYSTYPAWNETAPRCVKP